MCRKFVLDKLLEINTRTAAVFVCWEFLFPLQREFAWLLGCWSDCCWLTDQLIVFCWWSERELFPSSHLHHHYTTFMSRWQCLTNGLPFELLKSFSAFTGCFVGYRVNKYKLVTELQRCNWGHCSVLIKVSTDCLQICRCVSEILVHSLAQLLFILCRYVQKLVATTLYGPSKVT